MKEKHFRQNLGTTSYTICACDNSATISLQKNSYKKCFFMIGHSTLRNVS
jgi:hypothetical protein